MKIHRNRMKRNLWNSLVVLIVFVGIFGSMTAWEVGNIGFGRMLLQIALCSVMGYCAAMMAANTGRRSRRVGCPVRPLPVHSTSIHAA